LSSTGRAVLLYLEPTPYILGLLEEIRAQSPWPVEAWFLGQDLSQDWRLQLPDYCRIVDGSAGGAFREIRKVIRKPRVRILHLCGWGGHGALAPSIMLASLYGVPVVVESDTQEPFDAPLLRRLAKRVLYPALFRIPKMFLPGGIRQRDYLKSYGVPDAKLRIAQMTVDVASIKRFARGFGTERRAAWRSAHRIDQGAVVFLFVGRLEKHKGLGTLIAAFGQLAPSNLAARLVIVGDGSMREEVARAAAADSRILSCGRLQGGELLAAYCAADVLVLPSQFEPWGLVVNEAMACGLSVIASDRVGCVDDLILGRDTGIVYPAEQPEALLRAMRQAASNDEARRRMIANASRVIAGWTLQEEAARVVAAWNSVA